MECPVDGILSQIEQQDGENALPGEGYPRLVQHAVSTTCKSHGHDYWADSVKPHVNDGANDQNQTMPTPAPLRTRGQLPPGPKRFPGRHR